MYKKILVALENGRADQALLPHISQLAKFAGAELLLVHVADGWVARNYERLNLAESEEMRADRAYLDHKASELRESGLTVGACLALGDPAAEILKIGVRENCDLIAMTSHGHRFLADLVLGSTISEVRHKTTIPVLLVRALPATQKK
jgi:nucleotide-binding universal stress UspA family protein